MSDFIPAVHAEILFNRTNTGEPSTQVLVIDRRARNLGNSDAIHIGSSLRSSYGAMTSDWMTGKGRNQTPEGIFASEWLTAPVRPSLEAMKAALREFGKIDSCDWARSMFAAIEHDPKYGQQGEAE